MDEFERIVREDPSKLKVANPAGLCAAHTAAARGRVAILSLIAQYNGGIYVKEKRREIYVHYYLFQI